MKIKKSIYSPFLIKTDYTINKEYFTEILKDPVWHDSNELYAKYVKLATGGKRMRLFFVKPLRNLNFPVLRAVNRLFKEFNIRPREFRCDLFKVLPGGMLPLHIDQKSKISFCMPLSVNTGHTFFEQDDIQLKVNYQTMIILNNQVSHGVSSPLQERLIFRIGIHDISFEQLCLALKKNTL